ncbi:MAG: TIGR00282 family metallophosphoesterase [Pseudomonadota bacterium]
MRILFIGDIYGRSGREAVAKHLPILQEKLSPDIVIANGENSAHGIGITEKICAELYELGVDVITLGNHSWDQREIFSYIQRDKNLLRPLNYPEGTPGQGYVIHQAQNGQKILIMNAMGRVFMDPLDDPFTLTGKIVNQHKIGQKVDAIFVDFHAETTSESMSFAHYLDGKVSAIVGTHTHIPTADAQIFDQGTGFQCDAGMTGNYNSVIGVKPNVPIHRFTKRTPTDRKQPAEGEGTLCGTLIETGENGLCKNIAPVRVGPRLQNSVPEF